jgi:hypothetical protein
MIQAAPINHKCFLCGWRLSRIGVAVGDNRGKLPGFIVGICLHCNWGKGWNDMSFERKAQSRLASFFLGNVSLSDIFTKRELSRAGLPGIPQ